MNMIINPPKAEWPELLKRPAFQQANLQDTVREILDDVKQDGDASVLKYTAQFDKATLNSLSVTGVELENAAAEVSEALKEAIHVAYKNIHRFHALQTETVQLIETMPGVHCWRKSVPIEKVGLYIPGGSAPLFSTLLMLAVPAIIAGCKEIVLCTPPDADGNINPVIRYTAKLLGLSSLFKCGGVQAIAAMAYGTETIPAVYKIFGPGNQYVTAAKQMVNAGGVAIDMPAGPSEVAIYADETSSPEFIAADLLSQAEHGPDSQVLLVSPSTALLHTATECLHRQLASLPRKSIAALSLKHARFIVMEDELAAFDLLNEYAPEHLIIASDDAYRLAEYVRNAGSVFLGNYTPESAGDYASGTNHTLPTNGFAKAYSGVSVDSFIKKISFQHITAQGLQQLGPFIEVMAAAEGLDAHARAVSIRTKSQS